MECEDEKVEEEYPPIVILDPGSWTIKIGVTKDHMPTFQIPCLYIEKTFSNSRKVKFGLEALEDYTLTKYGIAKSKEEKVSIDKEDGELVNVKITFADPRHPLSTNDFTDLFEVYNYLIKKLNIKTADYNLLVAIPERAEKLYISNLLDWAFKSQKFASISFIYNSLAASYYYGLKTALVVDLGECASRISPISENYGIFLDSTKISEIGGYVISKYISHFMKINDNYIDYILVQNYKELNSYISLDIDRSIKLNSDCNGLSKPYKIPYNNIYIDPKAEILSHEIYFQPEFLAHFPGYYYKQNIISLNQLIFECICSCPMDLRKQLMNNIVLIGGVSNCINMHERLHKELMNTLKHKNYSENTKIHIKNMNMSDIASYLGCKKYGKLIYNNEKKWITREDYFSTPKNKSIQKLLILANIL
ncbi:actin-like protein [Plasmodium gonderi]|uniref:Actin-like protein n=1 Tax=Plasmodium gonderi TaxID=77519 RepID=A0A1Y1JC83_PLAGO|nr:actin-like protein [Plasmodium gonderi]GAW79278.1 actin-like protein [Plasmodium gonderi]